MRETFLVFGAPLIEEAEIAEVVDSLRSGWLGTGPKVARFEGLFRDYIGAGHAVAVSRDALMDRLHRLNIGAGVHFIGAHLQPYYARRFGHRPEDFPNATWISERTLSLPLSARLSDEDVDDVIGAVRHALG